LRTEFDNEHRHGRYHYAIGLLRLSLMDALPSAQTRRRQRHRTFVNKSSRGARALSMDECSLWEIGHGAAEIDFSVISEQGEGVCRVKKTGAPGSGRAR